MPLKEVVGGIYSLQPLPSCWLSLLAMCIRLDIALAPLLEPNVILKVANGGIMHCSSVVPQAG
jgi:hypothetical protein